MITTDDIRACLPEGFDDYDVEPDGTGWAGLGDYRIAYAAEIDGGVTWTVYVESSEDGCLDYVTTDGIPGGDAADLASAVAGALRGAAGAC